MRIAHPSDPRYPAPLRSQMAHAERLARLLKGLYDGAAENDPALIWLTGRAEEVATFVVDVHREWARGKLPTGRATDAIARYVDSLHRALEGWYGQWYAPSCCSVFPHVSESGMHSSGPRLRPSDVRDDTLPDTSAGQRTPRISSMSPDSSQVTPTYSP